jgi:hypothetical protein
MKTKQCNKCKEYKPLDNFSIYKRSKDGLRWECRECRNINDKIYRKNNYERLKQKGKSWRDAHRLELNAKNKKYYYENHDKVIEYSRRHYKEHAKEENARVTKFRKEHPEETKAYNKQYHLDNKEKEKEYQEQHKEQIAQNKKNYYLRNKEKCKERSSQWEKSHREKYNRWHKNRDLRKRSASGNGISHEDWETILERDKKCLWCEALDDLTLDHVIPIAKGGKHDISNAQVLCRKCNSKKNTKIIDFRPFGNAILEWT